MKLKPTGWAAPRDGYAIPVLFNPYSGEPRDARDIATDPQGILIRPPGSMLLAASDTSAGAAEVLPAHGATANNEQDQPARGSPQGSPDGLGASGSLSDEQIEAALVRHHLRRKPGPSQLCDAFTNGVRWAEKELRSRSLASSSAEERVADCLTALEAALEFIEQYEDVVDGSDGRQLPNSAMSLTTHVIKPAIAKAKRKPIPTKVTDTDLRRGFHVPAKRRGATHIPSDEKPDIVERCRSPFRNKHMPWDTLREAADEIETVREERDAFKSLMHDEVAENLRLRELGGGLPDENFGAFVERLIAERDSLACEQTRPTAPSEQDQPEPSSQAQPKESAPLVVEPVAAKLRQMLTEEEDTSPWAHGYRKGLEHALAALASPLPLPALDGASDAQPWGKCTKCGVDRYGPFVACAQDDCPSGVDAYLASSRPCTALAPAVGAADGLTAEAAAEPVAWRYRIDPSDEGWIVCQLPLPHAKFSFEWQGLYPLESRSCRCGG